MALPRPFHFSAAKIVCPASLCSGVFSRRQWLVLYWPYRFALFDAWTRWIDAQSRIGNAGDWREVERRFRWGGRKAVSEGGSGGVSE